MTQKSLGVCVCVKVMMMTGKYQCEMNVIQYFKCFGLMVLLRTFGQNFNWAWHSMNKQNVAMKNVTENRATWLSSWKWFSNWLREQSCPHHKYNSDNKFFDLFSSFGCLYTLHHSVLTSYWLVLLLLLLSL